MKAGDSLRRESYSNDNILKKFQQVNRTLDRFNKTYGTRERLTRYLEQEQINLTKQQVLKCLSFILSHPPYPTPVEATGFAAGGIFSVHVLKRGQSIPLLPVEKVCAHLHLQILTGMTQKKAVFEAVGKEKQETILKEDNYVKVLNT